MPIRLEAVRPIELADVQEARKRISGTILRTPLVRLDLGPDYPDIRLKLENLQPINVYKLCGRSAREMRDRASLMRHARRASRARSW